MKPAIAVRAENVPNMDWTVYQSMRDSLSQQKEISSFKQPREFQVSITGSTSHVHDTEYFCDGNLMNC